MVGTNHITYSSTDPGNPTGHVDVTNPDGSIQTIYYTYTKPDNYTETFTHIGGASVTQETINKSFYRYFIYRSKPRWGCISLLEQ